MPTPVDPSTRPPHLFRNGRPVRPTFAADEILYRRCLPNHILEGTVLADAFKFPDLSVMRSSECQSPDDARWVSEQEVGPGEPLVVYDDWSVIGMRVSDIPARIEGEAGGKPHDVSIQHVPYEDLFPHSEVWLLKDGVHVKKENKIPPTIKRKIRERLAALAVELDKPKR